MIHLFKSAASRTLTLALMGVVVLGLGIGAIRLALPFADLFRAQVEEVLSETLGYPVRMGELGIRLAGMVPRVTLRDVSLLDPDTGLPQLDLMELRLDLDLAASLLDRSPRVQSLTLVGAQLVVERDAGGELALMGLEGLERQDPRSMGFFLANGRFLIADSTVRWINRTSAAPPLELTDVRGRFDNAGARHRIGLSARLGADPGSQLRMSAELRGEAEAPGSWDGELYLDWNGGDPAPLFAGRMPAGLHLDGEKLRLRTWVRVAGSAPAEVLARVAAQGLGLRRGQGDDARTLDLDLAEGLLRWRREARGWRLEIADLALEHAGRRSPLTDAGLRLVRDEQATTTLTGGLEWLHLADLGAVLPLLPGLPPALADANAEGLAGEIRDLRLRVRLPPSATPEWALSTRVTGLRLEADRGRPGIAGLDAHMVATSARGHVRLAGEGFALDLPRIFEKNTPLRLGHLDGELFWRSDADGVHLQTPAIAMANDDVHARLRAALTLPPDGGSPILDLAGTFGDADLTAVRRYLPTAKLKARLEDWLERAFLAGRVPEGSLLFRGRLADFPFRAHQGRFELTLRAEESRLLLHKDWPVIGVTEAEVRFVDGSLAIEGTGSLYDSELTRISARIPDLSRAYAVAVQGTALGPFTDLVRLVEETPLERRLGPLTRVVRPEGRSRIALDMRIPLRRDKETPLRLAGAISWPEPASLAIPGAGLSLTDLGGAISFTDRAVARSRVTARLWEAPIALDVDAVPAEQEDKGTTQITAAASTEIRTLASRYASPLWDPLEGAVDWTLALDIPNAALVAAADQMDCGPDAACRATAPEPRDPQPGPPSSALALDFSLSSDLRGLAVGLPSPVGKRASQARPLRIEGRLAPGKDLMLGGRYGDMGLMLALVRDAEGVLALERGALVFGGEATALSKPSGVEVRGRLAELDLVAWRDWLDRRPARAGDAPARAGHAPALRLTDLRVARLMAPGARLTDARLTLGRSPGGWEAQVEAKELAGGITIPTRPRREPLRLALERLDLEALLAAPDGGESANGRGSDLDPRRTHTLALDIDRLFWGESDLGRLTARVVAVPEGLALTELSLDDRPLMQVHGSGRWTVEEGVQQTRVELRAKGDDLGKFLRNLGYQSQLADAAATAELKLAWPGSPTAFEVGNLRGEATAEVGKGSLIDVDPGVGRMLGVLNLGALQRRLSLDFSDLFERGYAFEKMTGDIVIKDGHAYIQDLSIDSPAAAIRIEGATDLVEQRFDQVVTVTPSVGTGVAIASAVAGGPLVGAAVLIADRVSGGAVDRLASYQYDVEGPWRDPDIRRRSRISGDAGPLLPPESGRAGAQRQPVEKPPETAEIQSGDEAAPDTPAAEPGRPASNLFMPGF
jgi:uncharacterized protein YhdP